MQPVQKKPDVPLEEALALAGGGLYTCYLVLTSGLVIFSSMVCLQSMSYVMPVAGSELQLSNAARGILSSMTFTGMLFSAQVFGFLADTFGRKRIIIHSQLATLVAVVLWSLAPDTITLGVILFVTGFMLTGTFTTTYVYVGESCGSNIRAKCLLCMSGTAAMANIYLPGMAWIILPLDVNIPIWEGFVFTPWRLYVLLASMPVLLSLLLLSKLTETPKFLLSQGKQEETLQVLKTIYAVNQGKSKEEFPVSSICLDFEDEESSKDVDNGNQFINYFRMMVKQIVVLFSRQYFLFIAISSALLFGSTGGCNTVLLWFPELTSRIRHYSSSHEYFNVTICDLMGQSNHKVTEKCDLNYDFLSAGILLGAVQVSACIFVGLFSNRMNKKLFLAVSTFMTAGICFLTIFLTSEYMIIVSLATMVIILYVSFPILVSIVVELFPTQLRSSATSITMTCARLGSAVGSQVMGVLYENHCEAGYFGITSILVATGILCILIPKKKSPS